MAHSETLSNLRIAHSGKGIGVTGTCGPPWNRKTVTAIIHPYNSSKRQKMALIYNAMNHNMKIRVTYRHDGWTHPTLVHVTYA